MNNPDPRKAFDPIGAAVHGVYAQSRLWLTLLVSALCFGLLINGSWNATPDSALYLSLGESLASRGGYLFNGEPHTFVPPGFPALLAGTAWLFGPHFLSYRVLMALMGLLTAWVGYAFVARLCGRDTGLVVGGLFAVNHALVSNSTLMLADVPFALFTLLGLHAVLSAARTHRIMIWTVIAGFAMSVLPLLRVNGLGVPPVAAFFLLCTWRNVVWRKRFALIALFLAVSFAPVALWQWWKAAFPVSPSEGSYANAILNRTVTDQLHVIAKTFWGYFAETNEALMGVTIKTGFLELLVPVVVLVGMVRALRQGDRLLAPLTAVQFCGLLLSSPGSRYLLFLIPALYLFLALGILSVAHRLIKDDGAHTKSGRVLLVCFAIVAVLNMGHNAITIAQARMPLESQGAETERSLPFFAASRWLKAHAPQATVLTTRARIIHYLSGCATVTLLRSGVPEHRTWVHEKDDIERLMAHRKPEFLFTDSSKADLYAQVAKTLRGLGFGVQLIPEATTSHRYHLYRIVPLEHPAQDAAETP